MYLSGLGYRVFAGVRTESCAVELCESVCPPGEIIPVLLDVTEAPSIARAGEFVEAATADTGLWGW